MNSSSSYRFIAILGVAWVLASCQPPDGAPAPSILHLADLLDEAAVVSGGAPASAREERRWDFDGVHPDWRTVSSKDSPFLAEVELKDAEGAMRLSLDAAGGEPVPVPHRRHRDRARRLALRPGATTASS